MAKNKTQLERMYGKGKSDAQYAKEHLSDRKERRKPGRKKAAEPKPMEKVGSKSSTPASSRSTSTYKAPTQRTKPKARPKKPGVSRNPYDTKKSTATISRNPYDTQKGSKSGGDKKTRSGPNKAATAMIDRTKKGRAAYGSKPYADSAKIARTRSDSQLKASSNTRNSTGPVSAYSNRETQARDVAKAQGRTARTKPTSTRGLYGGSAEQSMKNAQKYGKRNK